MSSMFGKLGCGHIFESLEYYTEMFQLFSIGNLEELKIFEQGLEEKYEMARYKL